MQRERDRACRGPACGELEPAQDGVARGGDGNVQHRLQREQAADAGELVSEAREEWVGERLEGVGDASVLRPFAYAAQIPRHVQRARVADRHRRCQQRRQSEQEKQWALAGVHGVRVAKRTWSFPCHQAPEFVGEGRWSETRLNGVRIVFFYLDDRSLVEDGLPTQVRELPERGAAGEARALAQVVGEQKGRVAELAALRLIEGPAGAIGVYGRVCGEATQDELAAIAPPRGSGLPVAGDEHGGETGGVVREGGAVEERLAREELGLDRQQVGGGVGERGHVWDEMQAC